MVGASGARVAVCGELKIDLHGAPVEQTPRGDRLRLLLGYLVLHRDRSCTREELIAALWPDERPESPGAALSVLLSRLRRTLGEGVVVGRSELRLKLPEPVAVDVEEASAALERARSGDGDADTLMACAGLAATILERDFLPGVSAPWVEEQRAELREWLADALEVIAIVAARSGSSRLHDAERAARRLIELSPYREVGHRTLMEVHAAHGNVAEALSVYEMLRVLLREELGVAPARDIQALHERLLHGGAASPARDSAADPGTLPLPPALTTFDEAPFVGRAPAVEQLVELLGDAGRGSARFAVLADEAGMGKTRLAARFGAESHARGATVLYGRCVQNSPTGYAPFVEALRYYAAHATAADLSDVMGDSAPEIARLLPELASRLDAGTAPVLGTPATQRQRLFKAIESFLRQLARQRPVVLVIDDLHEADGPSLALLRHLARTGRPERVLVVGAYRPDDVAPGHPLDELVARLRRERLMAEIALGPLGAADAVELMREQAGRPLPEALADALVRQSSGNPLFFCQMVSLLDERGQLDAVAAAADEQRELPHLLPPAAGEVIGRRLARLSDDAREALALAAVLGEAFDLELVVRASGWERGRASSALDEAVAADLVAVREGEREGHRFVHALVRAALYEQFGATRRAQLHCRIGRALEDLAAGTAEPPLGALSQHFFCARSVGEAERAVAYSLRAAERATALLAFEEAAELYERALAAMEAAADGSAVRCDALLALGEARSDAGRRADARDAFARASVLARTLEPPDRLARAALGFAGRGHGLTGAVDAEAVALLEEADRASGGQNPALSARVLSRLAVELYWSPEADRRRELSDRAVRLARQTGDPPAVAAALIAQTWANWNPDNPHERLRTTAEALDLARQARDEEVELEAWTWHIAALNELGRVAAVDRELDEYTPRADRFGRTPYVLYSRIGRGCRELMNGRYDEVQRLVDEVVSIGDRLEDPNTQGMVAAKRIWLAFELGGVEPLVPAVAPVADALPAMPVWRALLGLLYLHAGREEDARGELEVLATEGFAHIPRDMFWSMTVGALAELTAGLGDEPGTAARLYELLQPYADRNLVATLDVSLGSAERLLGRLAAAAGRHDVAEAHFRAALAHHTAWRAEPWRAHTLLAYARMLRARGTHGDAALAAEHIGTAREIAVRLRMTTLAQTIEGEAIPVAGA